jgi:uncharacterized protein (DUF1778 family)
MFVSTTIKEEKMKKKILKRTKPMCQMAFRVHDDEKKLIKRTARKSHCTVSDILRTAWQYFADNNDLI